MEINQETKEAILSLHLAIAFVDNNYSPEEEKFIGNLCKEYVIDFDTRIQVTKKIEMANTDMLSICKENLILIKDKEVQKKCIQSLMEICASDFLIYEDELMLLQLIADHWGVYISKKND